MDQKLYKDIFDLEGYHWWHVAKWELCPELMNKYHKGKPKILDIGCGTGKNLETFQKYGEAFGIDHSPEAINYCNQRGIKEVKLGSASKTPFPNQNFDIITMLDVLEHIKEEQETIKEINRLLKPGGLIILTVPAYKFLWSKRDEILHHRRYHLREIEEIMTRNNFKILKSSYLYSFLLIPMLLTRTIKSRLATRTGKYGSDLQLNNKLTNKLLGCLAKLEQTIFLRCNLKIPFGKSLISSKKTTHAIIMTLVIRTLRC